MSIKAKDLITKFQYALDNKFGYIYYATHEMWSAAKQAAYNRERANDENAQMSIKYGSKWYGHWVTDCSGLFAWSFKELGSSIAHGSNSIWNKYCSSKGTLSKGKRSDGLSLNPGTAVFTSSGDKHNHIGLYVGDGKVIEAMGTVDGVTTTNISNKKWTHWGELKNVTFENGPKQGGNYMTAKVVLPTGASGNNVNMRAKADRNAAILDKVPVGATVEVISDQSTWCQIRYEGLTGWMMSNYLEYSGQGGESGGDSISAAERKKIETALQTILNQVEVIYETLGRG